MVEEYDELHPFDVDTQYIFVKTMKMETFELIDNDGDITPYNTDYPINIIYHIDTRMVSEIILN